MHCINNTMPNYIFMKCNEYWHLVTCVCSKRSSSSSGGDSSTKFNLRSVNTTWYPRTWWWKRYVVFLLSVVLLVACFVFPINCEIVICICCIIYWQTDLMEVSVVVMGCHSPTVVLCSAPCNISVLERLLPARLYWFWWGHLVCSSLCFAFLLSQYLLAILLHLWRPQSESIVLGQLFTICDLHCGLQCFDAVGWAAGRASGL